MCFKECHQPSEERIRSSQKIFSKWDFLGGPMVKNRLCNAGDVGSILGQGTKTPYICCGATKPASGTTELMLYN